MKIVQLHSENIKRIKAIDITPEDNVVVLSGKNGEGKTSVLDSIWLALQYRAASKGNPNPLRSGTDKGFVSLDLGDYIVTRKFTKDDSVLEIKTPDGSKISSPQKLLDGMIGDLSFDPWEFSRKNEDDQRQMIADVLYSISNGKIDLASFEAEYKDIFEKRTECKREQKRLTTLLTTIRPPTSSDPTEEISAIEITESISKSAERSSKIELLSQKRKNILEKLDKLKNEVILLEEELKSAELEYQSLSNIKMPAIDELKSSLIAIERTNQRAREVAEYRKIKEALCSFENEIEDFNGSLELIEIEKAEALESSSLPVKGLRITPEGVQVLNQENKLIPFCQASAAQRLRISLAIAMAANPKLRVIRIADGSLLDDESMNIVREMANDKDFQVWIEYASRNENDRMGVYIEDGRIA